MHGTFSKGTYKSIPIILYIIYNEKITTFMEDNTRRFGSSIWGIEVTIPMKLGKIYPYSIGDPSVQGGRYNEIECGV